MKGCDKPTWSTSEIFLTKMLLGNVFLQKYAFMLLEPPCVMLSYKVKKCFGWYSFLGQLLATAIGYNNFLYWYRNRCTCLVLEQTAVDPNSSTSHLENKNIICHLNEAWRSELSSWEENSDIQKTSRGLQSLSSEHLQTLDKTNAFSPSELSPRLHWSGQYLWSKSSVLPCESNLEAGSLACEFGSKEKHFWQHWGISVNLWSWLWAWSPAIHHCSYLFRTDSQKSPRRNPFLNARCQRHAFPWLPLANTTQTLAQHLALVAKWEIKGKNAVQMTRHGPKMMLQNRKHGNGSLCIFSAPSPHVYSILLLTENTLHAQELPDL